MMEGDIVVPGWDLPDRRSADLAAGLFRIRFLCYAADRPAARFQAFDIMNHQEVPTFSFQYLSIAACMAPVPG